MTRCAYIDCVGGVAGDMVLGALLDADADVERLRSLPRRIGLDHVTIDVTRVRRHDIGALHVMVNAPPEPHGRSWRKLQALLATPEVPESAVRIFTRLAEAEAKVHGVAVADVEFHELGAADTIVDVCGAVELLESLGVERVVCSPIPVGYGVIRTAARVLPNPAPAALELLRGARLYGCDSEEELATPTGAAIVSTLAESYGPPPALSLVQVGYGAGTRDRRDRPNVVRVLIGDVADHLDAMSPSELVLLETNIDDMNPELVPDAVARCFSAGAVDVWTIAAQMKKGRPGQIFAALTVPDRERDVLRAILEETTSLGVRSSRVSRYELERAERIVRLGDGVVRVKIGLLGGRIVNAAPEHDDCAALASRTGRSVKSVWADALAAATTA